MYILVQPKTDIGVSSFKFSIHAPYIPTTIELLVQQNPDYYVIREL